MLTVQDIKKRQFSKKLRGYDSEEVDKFMDDVLIYITSIKKELSKSQEKVSDKEEELKKAEESIRDLMNKAQEIEGAIGQQDEVNDNLKDENSVMFKKLEKYGAQLEILKRENSDLEKTHGNLKSELESLIKENESLKRSVKDMEIQIENHSRKNIEYLEEINECRQREDSIVEVLLLAKKTGDEIIKKAEIEGKNIVINAEERESLLLKKIKILENRIVKLQKDFSEVVNYHVAAFENEIEKMQIVPEK